MTSPIEIPFTPEPAPGSGRSSRPPRWLPRALLYAVLAVFVGTIAWDALQSLKTLGIYLLLAFFISLALEPPVLWLVKRGWRRGAAAGVSLGGFILSFLVLTGLFGNLLVQQLILLVKNIPDLYLRVQDTLAQRFHANIPNSDTLANSALSQWGDSVSSGAIAVGTSIFSGIFAALTVLLVAYYLLASGPKFRATICQFLPPEKQTEVLRVWDITQVKVSGFINSRVILALISSIATFGFLTIIETPYSVPLALFTGLVSQFVPTIGTYIGGALPIVVALATPQQGLSKAIAILIFIVAYQQVENLWLAPKISARALEMNPAVSFVVVIGFGAVFGAVGAFIGLPLAAIIQAAASTYIRRHELIDSDLLHDPGSGWEHEEIIIVESSGDQEVTEVDDIKTWRRDEPES